ncbi:MAG: hypothetical protein CL609_02180 [Anaerolineaceae bacterium]|nr:hypothetical protein [Anaerolineaceae bacterium]
MILIFGVFLSGCSENYSTLVDHQEKQNNNSLTQESNVLFYSEEHKTSKPLTGDVIVSTPIQPTKQPTAEVEVKPRIDNFPDVIINYGPDIRDSLSGIYLCKNTPQMYLLFSEAPYTEFVFLPNEKDTDQLLPRISPDGNSIAYVDSKPESLYLFDPNQKNNPGSDKIRIINLGWDTLSISNQSLDREDFHTIQNDCEAKSYISSPPVWSPNSRYLTFSYTEMGDEFQHQLYLYDIETDLIILLINKTNNWDTPIWLNHDTYDLVDFNNDGLILISISSEGTIGIDEIPWPEYLDGKNYYFQFVEDYGLRVENKFPNNIVGSFSIYEKTKNKREYLSEVFFEFDLENKNWIKIQEINQKINNSIKYGDLIIGCDENNQVSIFDINNEEIFQKRLPGDNDIKCSTLDIVIDNQDTSWLSFWVVGNEGGLWITDPENKTGDFFKIIDQFNLPDVSKELAPEIFVSPHDFYNVIEYVWILEDNKK